VTAENGAHRAPLQIIFQPNEIFPNLNKWNLFTAAVFGLKKL
jgi:hypothetical protein